VLSCAAQAMCFQFDLQLMLRALFFLHESHRGANLLRHVMSVTFQSKHQTATITIHKSKLSLNAPSEESEEVSSFISFAAKSFFGLKVS